MSEATSIEDARQLYPIQDWHEDIGPVLWWRPPIAEPPYVGDPTWDDWPGYHTHFTLIVMPDETAIPAVRWDDDEDMYGVTPTPEPEGDPS